MMAYGFNLPESTGPNDPEAPWNKGEQADHQTIIEAWALAKALADKLDDLGIYWCGEISDLVTKLEGM